MYKMYFKIFIFQTRWARWNNIKQKVNLINGKLVLANRWDGQGRYDRQTAIKPKNQVSIISRSCMFNYLTNIKVRNNMLIRKLYLFCKSGNKSQQDGFSLMIQIGRVPGGVGGWCGESWVWYTLPLFSSQGLDQKL